YSFKSPHKCGRAAPAAKLTNKIANIKNNRIYFIVLLYLRQSWRRQKRSKVNVRNAGKISHNIGFSANHIWFDAFKIKLTIGLAKISRSKRVAPAQNDIPRKIAPNVNEVPRSGCLKTKMAGNKIMAAALKMSQKDFIGW